MKGVLALLREGADEHRVADRLASLARVSMGLGDRPLVLARAQLAAKALIAARDG